MHTLVHVAAPLVGADGVGRGNHVRRRIRAAHAPPIGRPQGIAPTRHPQERGAGTVCDAVSAPPMHRRSGDHKGSPLQDTRRREAREPCATPYPRRPCTADRATKRDHPYKTPAGERRGNHVRRRIRAAHAPPIGRPQGIAPTRHPQERGAGTVYDDVSAPPMNRQSGDHKGSPLQNARRREAREPCTTPYPRRPCISDRATTKDRPYGTPAGEERRKDGV